MITIERAERGSSWFVVDRKDNGQVIVHASLPSQEEAVEYMQTVFGRTPTQDEVDEAVRADERVRFRQRYKRQPSRDELDTLTAARKKDGIAGRRIEQLRADDE